jgi:uncharacterized protein YdhG (YjbR/CyaY superfamily)
MKKVWKAAGLVLATVLFASCGGGSKIKEIALFPVKSGDDYQYVNRKGEIVINPQFKQAALFHDGLALVLTSGDNPQWGYIDEAGKFVINAQYKEATSFSEGLAWVVEKDKAPAAIDTKGEVKFTLPQAETVFSFSDGLAAFTIKNDEGEEVIGFVNTKGEVTINPQFDEVGKFSDGLCAFRSNKDGKSGFIDKEGKIVINQQFELASDFENGLAVVKSGEKYGVVNKEGKYTINPQFDGMMADGDLFMIEQDGKTGWCDSKGTIVINPQFKGASLFGSAALTSVSTDKEYGYIDREGKFVINPQFKYALPFNGSLALVANTDSWGLIDTEGKYSVNPQFSGISNDMHIYLILGRSLYNSVNTDYFDINAIVSAINFDSPEGFTAQTTFNDVKTKYNLKESKFSKTKVVHAVAQKEPTKNTSIGVSVIGKAFDSRRVQKGSGYWAYYSTEYGFVGKNKIAAVFYTITSPSSKQSAIFDAITTKLNSLGYELEIEERGQKGYIGKKTEVDVRMYEDNAVTVQISFVEEKETTTQKDTSLTLQLNDTEFCDGGELILTVTGGKAFSGGEPFKIEVKHIGGAKGKVYLDKFKRKSDGKYVMEMGTGNTSEYNEDSKQQLIITDADGNKKTIDFVILGYCA